MIGIQKAYIIGVCVQLMGGATLAACNSNAGPSTSSAGTEQVPGAPSAVLSTTTTAAAAPVSAQTVPSTSTVLGLGAAGAAQGAAVQTAPAVSAMLAPTAPMATAGSAGNAMPALGADWCAVHATLEARCTVCHNEQKLAGAPMSLRTHADLIAPAVSNPNRKVYELVSERIRDKQRPMPPQNPLTAEQVAGIDAWVAAGAAATGEASCPASTPTNPAVPAWPAHCDETYVIRSAPQSAPNTIAAGEETHPLTTVPAPWGDEEVQAIAWHSLNDNLKVLHHWILYGPQGEFLFGWAPGKDYNQPLPEDVGVYLAKGDLQLDMHYNNIAGTQPEKDASAIEICVLKKPNFRPKTATITMALSPTSINIPAHSTNTSVTGTCTHDGSPVRLLSASPHAHTNATHMKFTVEKANGQMLVMHDAAFSFSEQTTYPLDPPVVIEKGDRIITTCTYKNETDQAITFGEDTGNEMCFNFAMYEPMGGLRCSSGPGMGRWQF